MSTRANVPSMAIFLGVLAALVAARPARAQIWPTSMRRMPGDRPTTMAHRPITTTPTAARAVPRDEPQPDPHAAAWRDFITTRAAMAPDPRPSTGRLPGQPVSLTSYYPGLRDGRTCSPSRASLLVRQQPRPLVRDEPPPLEFQSWGNHEVRLTTSALSRRRGREWPKREPRLSLRQGPRDGLRSRAARTPSLRAAHP